MTELKTLEDIEFDDLYVRSKWGRADLVISSELRQEAIKWIKNLEESYFDEDLHIINWIKTFFNITEEELKEQEK